MATFIASDGAEIYYKDWGTGQPVIFSHGWPLDGDMWQSQMIYLASRGYRTIAFDRRGFGRSSQPWQGYGFDRLADDVAELIETLDLRDVLLVGFSMGGGEVVRYTGRHGSRRVAKLALISAVTPFMLKTDENQEGIIKSVFDGMRAGVQADHPQFIRDFSVFFYGTIGPAPRFHREFWSKRLPSRCARRSKRLSIASRRSQKPISGRTLS
jgi:non-heme chloroperoxidase